ncbi:hypothetical protein D9M69_659010 [compost metagenome]
MRSWKAWITASPRASEVMKFGSPVKASMRLAGDATMGGARDVRLMRDSSVMVVVLAWSFGQCK